jgi:hypothetical protein
MLRIENPIGSGLALAAVSLSLVPESHDLMVVAGVLSVPLIFQGVQELGFDLATYFIERRGRERLRNRSRRLLI